MNEWVYFLKLFIKLVKYNANKIEAYFSPQVAYTIK